MEQWSPNTDYWQQAEAFADQIMAALEAGLVVDEIIIDYLDRAKAEALNALPRETEGSEQRALLNNLIGRIVAIEELLRAAEA